MTRSELQSTIGGTVFAGASPLLVTLPDPVKQALLASAAALVGWATTLVLNWLKKRLGD